MHSIEKVPCTVFIRLVFGEFNVEPGKNNIADFALKSGGKIIEERE
jgi:hypothetical protein